MAEPNPFLDYDHNPFADDDDGPAPAPAPAPKAAPAAAPPAAAQVAPVRPPPQTPSPPNAFASPERSRFGEPTPLPPSTNPFGEGAAAAGARPARAGRAPAAAGPIGERPNNWPRCRPCARLAIEEDIPSPHRMTVRLAYAGYLLSVSAALANALALIVLLARRASDSGKDTGTAGDVLGLAAGPGYVLLVGLVGWWALKHLYNGAARDRSRGYCCFFLCGGGLLGFLLLAVVGLASTYMCGVMTMVEVGEDWVSEADIIVVAVSTALWLLAFIINALTCFRAHQAYRGKDEQGLREAAADGRRQAAQSLLSDAQPEFP
mmetsp:Transcript_18733/g.71267  ORF Transcript_18733/g.71267 Transcript_18733/m.71267 type:complete len:319 (-) Transcript_18733:61-1017(-)